MRVLHPRGFFGLLLALFIGGVSADAHICIPGVFGHDPGASSLTNHDQDKALTSPDSITSESDAPSVPSLLITPASYQLKGTAEFFPPVPPDAADGPSSSTTSAVPVLLLPKAAIPQKGKGETAAPASDRFRWRTALMESMFYTGIMHAFRFSTEAGTRDALNGQWFNHWMSSVGEIRGWDDHDPFITDDVAHPLEGAIFGFIQQQNDPKYRYVMWGSGRDYWISRLRALSFSAIMSTQWKIGPASEASLGNVQLHEPAGFTDLVITPTVGIAVVMIGEDLTDRYVITALENRTSNIPVLLLSRCFMNPSRTFANMMALKAPWHRDTRFGIFGADHELRKELLKDYKEGTTGRIFEYDASSFVKPDSAPKKYPLEAPIELMATTQYESFLGGGSCIGGGGSGAARINPSWQFVAEANGCMIINMPKDESADSEMYVVGTRWAPLASHRVSPYGQVLIGGRRITHEIDDFAKKHELLDEWDNGNGTLAHYPMRSDWSVEHMANGFVVEAGGGVDFLVSRALAWRVANLEYTHTWISRVDQINASEGIKFTSGLILRIGTW
jgi:hypothetical protein